MTDKERDRAYAGRRNWRRRENRKHALAGFVVLVILVYILSHVS